jgi:hypothetical protein
MTRLRLAERRTLLRLAILGALVIAAGVWLGWRAGAMDDVETARLAKETWALSPPVREDPTRDLALLAARHPWRGPTEDRRERVQRPPPLPRWRLAGIVQRGDEKFALITVEARPLPRYEYRRVGDTLPDGSILVQIMEDGAKTESHPSPESRPSSGAPPAASPPPSASKSSSANVRTYRLFEKK